ncbi:MAG: flagellar biosynthetic protein FliO [Magnetococcales bacterium]|nr:flagellar biosynthetic protein FliO [Magnetococcales bacterium]
MRPTGASRPAIMAGVMSLVLCLGVSTLWADSGQPVDLAGEAARVAGYLLLLMALGALAVRISRKYTPGIGGGGPIRIEDGRNFSPGVGVRLVRVGSRVWLLGVSRDRVTLLAEMAPEELVNLKDQPA